MANWALMRAAPPWEVAASSGALRAEVAQRAMGLPARLPIVVKPQREKISDRG